jgi:hypothetical protein
MVAAGSPAANQSSTSRAACRVCGRFDGDAVVAEVLAERVLGFAVAELVESIAFPGVDLPDVVPQLERKPTLHERAEGAARLEFGQLPVIAYEHDLALGGKHGVDELGDLPRRDHARLIDHEHAPLRHRPPTAPQVGQQRERARALDPGPVLQLGRGPARGRNAEHRMAG